MLYILSPGLPYFITRSLYLFTFTISPAAITLLWQHQSVEPVLFVGFDIQVKSHGICLSLSVLTQHNALKIHPCCGAFLGFDMVTLLVHLSLDWPHCSAL